MEDPNDSRQLVLKPWSGIAFAQRETGIFQRLQDTEGLVEVEQNRARYRVVVRVVSTRTPSVRDGCDIAAC